LTFNWLDKENQIILAQNSGKFDDITGAPL